MLVLNPVSMKLLMIFCNKFSFEPGIKTLDQFETVKSGKSYNNILAGFIQAEKEDEADPSGVEKKLIKNLKWAAKKNETKTILLHSFAHLSNSKAEPEFTKGLFDQSQQRLENADYKCYQTPFGYFLHLNLDAPGNSHARIFKSF